MQVKKHGRADKATYVFDETKGEVYPQRQKWSMNRMLIIVFFTAFVSINFILLIVGLYFESEKTPGLSTFWIPFVIECGFGSQFFNTLLDKSQSNLIRYMSSMDYFEVQPYFDPGYEQAFNINGLTKRDLNADELQEMRWRGVLPNFPVYIHMKPEELRNIFEQETGGPLKLKGKELEEALAQYVDEIEVPAGIDSDSRAATPQVNVKDKEKSDKDSQETSPGQQASSKEIPLPGMKDPAGPAPPDPASAGEKGPKSMAPRKPEAKKIKLLNLKKIKEKGGGEIGQETGPGPFLYWLMWNRYGYVNIEDANGQISTYGYYDELDFCERPWLEMMDPQPDIIPAKNYRIAHHSCEHIDESLNEFVLDDLPVFTITASGYFRKMHRGPIAPSEDKKARQLLKGLGYFYKRSQHRVSPLQQKNDSLKSDIDAMRDGIHGARFMVLSTMDPHRHAKEMENAVEQARQHERKSTARSSWISIILSIGIILFVIYMIATGGNV